MAYGLARSCGATAVLLTLLTGCSVKRIAVNKIGNVLASGGSVFESDEDLELVGSALPFGLKTMESLLAESPKHRGLLFAACQGFTTYSYLYVQQDADRMADQDLAGANRLRARARRLFLRAHRYGFRALETIAPGFGEQAVKDPGAAAARIRGKGDAALLYWNAAALGLAISASKDDAAMLARLPEVEAILARALELDETWSDGALHEFQVTLAGAKPGPSDFARIETHYQRAIELSKGKHAGVHVAYAEAVSVPKQDRDGFRKALDRALAIDADLYPESRLANLAAQRRAQWLLGRMDELILPPAAASEDHL
jgi:predicted anti-sigma-YlaC factor YlaD